MLCYFGDAVRCENKMVTPGSQSFVGFSILVTLYQTKKYSQTIFISLKTTFAFSFLFNEQMSNVAPSAAILAIIFSFKSTAERMCLFFNTLRFYKSKADKGYLYSLASRMIFFLFNSRKKVICRFSINIYIRLIIAKSIHSLELRKCKNDSMKSASSMFVLKLPLSFTRL